MIRFGTSGSRFVLPISLAFCSCSGVRVRPADTEQGQGYELVCKRPGDCEKKASKVCKLGYSVLDRTDATASLDDRTHWTIACTDGAAASSSAASPPASAAAQEDAKQPAEQRSLTPREIATKALPGLVLVSTPEAQGSGFCIGNGLVVTNVHVVAGAGAVSVKTHSGGTWPVVAVRAFDLAADVVLLEVPGIDAKPLRLELVATPAPGDPVIALGAPRGLSETVTAGIVSALRTEGDQQFLQHTAPISPGSSGGPILNDRGRVVGVTRFLFKDSQNLNFASPASAVRALVDARPERILVADFGKATQKKPAATGAGQEHASVRPVCGHTSFANATAPEKTNAASCFGAFLDASDCHFASEVNATLCRGAHPFFVKWRDDGQTTIGLFHFPKMQSPFLRVYQAETGEFVYTWADGVPAGACAFMGDTASWCFNPRPDSGEQQAAATTP